MKIYHTSFVIYIATCINIYKVSVWSLEGWTETRLGACFWSHKEMFTLFPVPVGLRRVSRVKSVSVHVSGVQLYPV